IGKRRGELYHWLTRADVIATTNGANLGDIKQPLVIYYDVYLINEFYPNQFYGAGSACERKPLIVDPCPLYDSDTGFSQPRDCSTGYILNPDGSVRSLEEGERIQPGGDCKARGSGNLVILECLLPDGSIANLVSFRSVRPQLGCASLNSGRTKTGPDPKGYSFVLTVRTVSIGSSYN
ncbi:MAG: hypothetical protein HY819_06535, partial [Acidobacteria bacterium]|nr:hypothetical protein [Acidobacteriota bacterium]